MKSLEQLDVFLDSLVLWCRCVSELSTGNQETLSRLEWEEIKPGQSRLIATKFYNPGGQPRSIENEFGSRAVCEK